MRQTSLTTNFVKTREKEVNEYFGTINILNESNFLTLFGKKTRKSFVFFMYSSGELDLWKYTYLILGIAFLIFFIFYIWSTIRDTINDSSNIQGKFWAQISYLIALFAKAACLIVSAIFLFVGFAEKSAESNVVTLELLSNQTEKSSSAKWGKYQILPGAIPGYLSACAYAFIFFSWCSVCYDALEKSTIGFYKQIKTVLIGLTAIIILSFIISICLIFTLEDVRKPATAEALIASIRDWIIAFCFIMYFWKISSLFTISCPHMCIPENRLFWLLIMLIVSLTLRPVCALVYNFAVANGKIGFSEFSAKYYVIFLIEFIITEAMPLFLVGYTHLTSSDSYSGAKDDNVAAFLALD